MKKSIPNNMADFTRSPVEGQLESTWELKVIEGLQKSTWVLKTRGYSST